MNIEEFLAPISPDKPCGENLEYDADFQIMNQASQGKAEQQFGDTIIPAEPADWNTVEKFATSLLTRTKDLRVLLALTHAGHVAVASQAMQTGCYWCRKP